MCHLYSMTRGRAEVAALIGAMDRINNQRPMPGVYPDYAAPVVINNEAGGREMRDVRWGMPTSKQALFNAASARADKLRAMLLASIIARSYGLSFGFHFCQRGVWQRCFQPPKILGTNRRTPNRPLFASS